MDCTLTKEYGLSVSSPQSPNLSALSWSWATPPLAMGAGFGSVSTPGLSSPTVEHPNGTTWGGPSFADELCERILVLPRLWEIGFVMSDQVRTVEVWSTFRNQSANLQALDITGSGGLEIDGPAAMIFGPLRSQVYQATIPGNGPASILNVATWTFDLALGVDLTVLGTRVTAFAFKPDWSEPFRERIAWKTSVLTSYNGSEQRISLRTKPRYTASFRVVTLTPQETQELEALLAGWQTKAFGVPWWPEYTFLDADALPGSLALSMDTTDRPSFVAGGMLILWSSPRSWEVLTLESVSASGVTLTSQTTGSWPAGTRVLPLRLGWLLDQLPLDRPTNWITASTFTFSCDAL